MASAATAAVSDLVMVPLRRQQSVGTISTVGGGGGSGGTGMHCGSSAGRGGGGGTGGGAASACGTAPGSGLTTPRQCGGLAGVATPRTAFSHGLMSPIRLDVDVGIVGVRSEPSFHPVAIGAVSMTSAPTPCTPPNLPLSLALKRQPSERKTTPTRLHFHGPVVDTAESQRLLKYLPQSQGPAQARQPALQKDLRLHQGLSAAQPAQPSPPQQHQQPQQPQQPQAQSPAQLSRPSPAQPPQQPQQPQVVHQPQRPQTPPLGRPPQREPRAEPALPAEDRLQLESQHQPRQRPSVQSYQPQERYRRPRSDAERREDSTTSLLPPPQQQPQQQQHSPAQHRPLAYASTQSETDMRVEMLSRQLAAQLSQEVFTPREERPNPLLGKQSPPRRRRPENALVRQQPAQFNDVFGTTSQIDVSFQAEHQRRCWQQEDRHASPQNQWQRQRQQPQQEQQHGEETGQIHSDASRCTPSHALGADTTQASPSEDTIPVSMPEYAPPKRRHPHEHEHQQLQRRWGSQQQQHLRRNGRARQRDRALWSTGGMDTVRIEDDECRLEEPEPSPDDVAPSREASTCIGSMPDIEKEHQQSAQRPWSQPPPDLGHRSNGRGFEALVSPEAKLQSRPNSLPPPPPASLLPPPSPICPVFSDAEDSEDETSARRRRLLAAAMRLRSSTGSDEACEGEGEEAAKICHRRTGAPEAVRRAAAETPTPQRQASPSSQKRASPRTSGSSGGASHGSGKQAVRILDHIAASVIRRPVDSCASTPSCRKSPDSQGTGSVLSSRKLQERALLHHFWRTWAGLALSAQGREAQTPKGELPAMVSSLALKRDPGSRPKLDILHELEVRVAPCWGDLLDPAAANGTSGEESLLQLSPLTPSLCSGMSHRSTCQSDLSSLPSPLMPPASLSETRPLSTAPRAQASPECSTDAEAPEHPQPRPGALCQHAAVLSYRLLQKERQCAALREAISRTGRVRKGAGGNSSSTENWRDGDKVCRLRQGLAEGADACKRDASRGVRRTPFASCENLI